MRALPFTSAMTLAAALVSRPAMAHGATEAQTDPSLAAETSSPSGAPFTGNYTDADPPTVVLPRLRDDPTTQAWQLINWVVATHDNHELPFMVVDKVAAEVFVFDSGGQRIGSSPVLVGMAVGDEETPALGDREMSKIPIKDRMTPAGRFIAKLGPAAGHRDVLWIDYSSSISLHGVIAVKGQHRLERLKSPTPKDNRITFGCINVPTAFYDKIVRPVFKSTAGVVYVLPETKMISEVFTTIPSEVQQSRESPESQR